MKLNWKKWTAVLLVLAMLASFGSYAAFAGDESTDPAADTAEQSASGTETPATGTETPAADTETPATPDPADPCAAGHDWGDWIVQAATCTTSEIKTHYCKRCGTPESVMGELLGHDWKTVESKEPDCENGGYTKQKCARCNAEQTVDEKAALGHDYTQWTVTQKGDCTTDEIRTRSCNRCHKNFTETNAAAGHDWKETVVEPKCEEGGYTLKKCSKCGKEVKENETVPTGHKVVVEPEVAPTCQEEGKTEKRYCEYCNTVFLESKKIEKIDHNKVRIPPIAATCTAPGQSEKIYCDMCGTVFQEPEETPMTGHSYITTVITAATCTAEGLSRETCEYCDDTHTVVTAALGHDFVDDWIVEATCTGAGVRVRTCKVCGYQTDKENVAALGHDLEKAWTIDKAPTCTASGTKSHHCTRCGNKYDVTTLPKNGHDYDITVKPATTKKDGTKTYVCKVCGKTVTKVIYQIASIALNKTSYTCDNKVKTPSVVVKNTGDKKLVKGTHYKVTYEKGRKTVGTYKVTVTFIGDYKGSKTLKFTIKLAKTTGVTLKNASGHKVNVSYDKVKGAEKYCIYYATEKNGKYTKLVNNTKLSYTTKALKSGKTYYFKVRAVAADANGKNKFGAYSAISKIKVK